MAMTLPQAEIIFEGWRASPPAHHMMQILARAWGWKGPPRSASSNPGEKMDMAALAAIPGMRPGKPTRDAAAKLTTMADLKAWHVRRAAEQKIAR